MNVCQELLFIQLRGSGTIVTLNCVAGISNPRKMFCVIDVLVMMVTTKNDADDNTV
jgi:hypothetical protein